MGVFIGGLYLVAVGGLVFFGVHRFKMVFGYLFNRPGPPVEGESVALPREGATVCIQCPVYNEPLVIEGLLKSVAAIDWYPGQLEIQILDDSDDETPSIISRWLEKNPRWAGVCRHLRRSDRSGYKAGALASGMRQSRACFFAVFDADFRPSSDFLRVMMPAFTDPSVGLVQARWDFSNRRAGFLTRLQAVFLDAHFVVEQVARAAGGLFFNFNGTAGIWRRDALEDAGGWSADTVTEDLDISYRAQMKGWRFVYLPHYTVKSELPEHITAFKSQQRRWTKGGIQVMRKLLPALMRSNAPLSIKIEGFYHLTVGFVHFFLVLFALVFVPFLVVLGPVPGGAFWFVHPIVILGAGASTVLFYLVGQFCRDRRWLDLFLTLVMAPLVLSFGLAMSLTCLWAVFDGLFTSGGEFVRTPKGGRNMGLGGILRSGRFLSQYRILAGCEGVLAVVMLGGAATFAERGLFAIASVLVVKAVGYIALVGWFVGDSIGGDEVPQRLEPIPATDSGLPFSGRRME
ncbi:MAG: glycosyl transferase family 2 [Verrucomicrobia bacterium]|nr:MAG: glycosyl transferase family 2 [Verrucomicrobiota bacterium]